MRITTRVAPDFLNTMLFGTMHECGHALYGLGVAPELERTGLEGGASLAVHEFTKPPVGKPGGAFVAILAVFLPTPAG